MRHPRSAQNRDLVLSAAHTPTTLAAWRCEPETRLSPDDIARELGFEMPHRNSRASAYTDLIDLAVEAYWEHRAVPTQRKATE